VKHLQHFVRQYPSKTFERGATILMQDAVPESLYAIKSGFVKGYDIDGQGSEQLVWLGGENDIFPLSVPFAPLTTVPYFFSAFSDVELHIVAIDEFNTFIEENRTGLLEVTQTLATRLADTFRHLNAAEKTRAEDKIIHALQFLSQRFGCAGYNAAAGREIKLPITHQDIASLLGLTRETVTVELKKLKDGGYIFYDKANFIMHEQKFQHLL
jgi:CRP-like cAMP-binding protein